MADSVDRVFGHALNTVNKIRPGSQKPPSSDRLALYGLYKQSMEGDVASVAERPTASASPGLSAEALKKEQEKWDAWKGNEGLSRTEAKRRYIEKLIQTMHEYASGTDEAKELVEELEFVWDQIKSNSQHSSSERSSPLQNLERSGYMSSGNGGISSSAAAMERTGPERGGQEAMRVLSPVSQADEEEEALEEEGDEFVDAPVSQVDMQDVGDTSEPVAVDGAADDSYAVVPRPRPPEADSRWRKRIESSLIRLTTEVAALREQLESRRFIKMQHQRSWFGWVLRVGWWFAQFIVADAVLLWLLLFYLRRRQDRRLEGALRVLLGDAVAQAQKVGREVKMPTLPRIKQRKSGG